MSQASALSQAPAAAPPAPGVLPGLHGAPLRDRDGVVVGVVADLLVHAPTSRPSWFVVRLPDGRSTVVPVTGSRASLRGPRVPYPATIVEACPVARPGVPACRHYGVRAAVDALAPMRGAAAALAA
jgi:hypothetical protein